MSVVLPAPFSPTIACTVPGAIESVTASLATTPPKRRVTSRAPSRISGGTGSGLVVLRIALIDHVPDLDRAVDDPLLGLVHVGHDVVRHVLLRVLHLRQSDAVLLQAERAVLAALELAAGVVLDELLHGEVGALDHRGQYGGWGGGVLVGVDADRVAVLRLGGLDHARAGAAGHVVDDVGAAIEHRVGDLLALARVAEIVGVGGEDLHLRVGVARALDVAHEELVYAGRLRAAD